jgi:hypothetical protein
VELEEKANAIFDKGFLSAMSHLPTQGAPCLFWGGDKTTCWVAQSLSQTLIDTPVNEFNGINIEPIVAPTLSDEAEWAKAH